MKTSSRALFALLVLWCGAAWAVDPSARWFTIETPNFRVHFHEGPNMYALAQRTARICEAAHAALVPRLRWTPAQKTDVILTDDVDSANGSAFTLYRPWMRLFAEVPDDQSVLNDFDDYLWNLVVHEYTHVLHLDTATGIPAMVNDVFGKMLIPNALVPRWLTEGLATYQESNLSNSGRLRSSLFEMWLRTSVLERPYDISEVSHVPFGWPRGNLAYLYGGHFMAYVAERVGEDKLPEYFRLYGSRLIPWTLNDTAQTVWDVDFVRLYDDWMAASREKFEAQLAPVKAAGLTPHQRLTSSGYGTDQPHFTPDGERIIYLEAGPDRRPQLRWMRPDGTDDALLRELWTSGAFDVAPDGNRVVLSLADVYEEHYVYEDLYELDLATKALTRLSTGLRASEPAYSSDGRHIAFIGRSGGGHSYLGVLDPLAGEARRIFEASADQRLFTPVFAPDGKSVVVSQKAGTGRRLVAVELATGEATELLSSEAMLMQPAFSADGLLLFASDITGIYNLYAHDLGSGATRQLTNVTTGAFHPDPSSKGDLIAFVSYGVDGYDVATMKVADAFAGALPPRAPRPPNMYRDDPRTALPVREYDAVETLLPYYWLPLYAADLGGAVLGITTGGGDILDRHRYTLEASYGLGSKEPGFYAAYSNRTFHPGIDVFALSGIAQAAGFGGAAYDRHTAGGAQMTFPNSSFDAYSAVSLGYEYRYYAPQFDVSLFPDSPRPRLPRRGSTGVASLSFYFSNARGFANSVSAEEGHAFGVTLRHSSPYTLGTFTFTSMDARYQTYLRAPWGDHHAFALQLLGASALGDIGERPVYAIGGIGLAEPFLQLIRGQRVGSGALRGYAPRALSGNSYALGTLEYRFPIAVFDEGVATLPFFFRRLHGAAFTDAGAVGRRAFELGAPRFSVGAEARADVVVGYGLYTMLRLGLAQGLSEGGITNVYLTLGSSF